MHPCAVGPAIADFDRDGDLDVILAASTARDMQINVTPQVDGASPIFREQQVNTYEANEQHVPVTIGLQGPNNGGYVVIWRSYTQDGDHYGVYGQRYDAKGAAVGAEFQVNSQTLGAQYEPEVTSLANGGFVVAWRGDSGQDGSGAGVYGQIYGADGARVGAERQFNATTTSSQYEPALVGLADGSFVVAYRSDYTNAAGTYLYDVLARRFDAAGLAAALVAAGFTVVAAEVIPGPLPIGHVVAAVG